MIISIMGLIGAGKSTLVKSLKDKCNYEIFLEPTSESEGSKNNPFLNLYYEDPQRWSYTMQTFLLFERHNMLCEAYYKTSRNNDVCILDGCCESDRAFSLVQLQNDYFNKDEYNTYCNMYNDLRANRPSPDLYIWLEIEPIKVLERIKNRSCQCESTIPLKYLQQLYNAYKLVLSTIDSNKIAIVDASKSINEVYNEVTNIINNQTKGLQ